MDEDFLMDYTSAKLVILVQPFWFYDANKHTQSHTHTHTHTPTHVCFVSTGDIVEWHQRRQLVHRSCSWYTQPVDTKPYVPTHTHTESHTDATKCFTPATVVGVSNKFNNYSVKIVHFTFYIAFSAHIKTINRIHVLRERTYTKWTDIIQWQVTSRKIDQPVADRH